MCRASGSGIFAISAEAALRAVECEELFRRLDSLDHPNVLTGFFPCPLVVLCATLNQEPPEFLIADARCNEGSWSAP